MVGAHHADEHVFQGLEPVRSSAMAGGFHGPD